MNSKNTYQAPFIPKLNMSSTHSLPRLPSANDSLRIPPFPQVTIPELTGYKRHSSSSHINEAPPTKKVKVGSFNLFSRPTFTESDPYCPEGAYTQKQASCQKLIHEKLNNKLVSTKGINITFSSKVKESKGPCENQMFHSQQLSGLQAKFSPDLRAKLIQETLRRVNPVNESKQLLCHLISKKIEENCLTLAHKMQDLLILRHLINPENIKIPGFDNGIIETMPGTPCTVSAESSTFEVKSEAEVSYPATFENEKKTSPVRSETKKRSQDSVEKKEGFVSRKMNKLQVVKEQTEELKKPYVISLNVKEGEMSEKIVATRVGEEYQVSIPVCKKEENSLDRQIKLRSSPESQL